MFRLRRRCRPVVAGGDVTFSLSRARMSGVPFPPRDPMDKRRNMRGRENRRRRPLRGDVMSDGVAAREVDSLKATDVGVSGSRVDGVPKRPRGLREVVKAVVDGVVGRASAM